MISALGFANFQGFEHNQTVRLAPLTLIFGPNSSGKSSILRALRLLAQVGRGPGLPLNGRHIEMGTFRSAVFNGDEERSFTISTETLEGPLGSRRRMWSNFFRARAPRVGVTEPASETNQFRKPDGNNVQSSKLRFEFEIDAVGGGTPKSVRVEHDLVFVDKSASGWDEKEVAVQLVFSRYPGTESQFRLTEISGVGRLMVHVEGGRVRSDNGERQISEVPAFSDGEWEKILFDAPFELRSGLFPSVGSDQSAREMSFLPGDELIKTEATSEESQRVAWTGFERYIDMLSRAVPDIDLAHIGPLRSISPGFQSLEGSSDLKSDASNLVSFLAGLPERSMDRLSGWLSKLTAGRYTMVMSKAETGGTLQNEDGWRDTGTLLFQVGLKDHHTKTYISPQNAGVGLSQILPILGSLALLQENRSSQKLVLVEQPELHLHPRMQADFADVLVEAHRKSEQIIIETHSEALMLRLQKLVRRGEISATDVSVLFVDQFPGGGNLAQELRLDVDGTFRDSWPTSFGELRWNEQIDDQE